MHMVHCHGSLGAARQCTHLMYALLVVEVDQDEDGGADDATVPADKPGAHSQ